MSTLTRRAQILFSPEQYSNLHVLSAEAHTSIGELVREAVDKVYGPETIKKRIASAKRLINLNVSTGTWRKIERQIIKGAIGS
ncbi:hypothetical protein KAX22_08080 [bacterium]|nr:hypothetical protein [bacterium]